MSAKSPILTIQNKAVTKALGRKGEMTMDPLHHKICARCGKPFKKNRNCSASNWNRAKYCSITCIHRKHGLHNTRLYRMWHRLKTGCLDIRSPHFKKYGNKGVQFHPEWVNDPVAFVQDVPPDPGRKYTLGRIDETKGFEPGNLKWEPRKKAK